MYNKIINPKTGRSIKITSKLGRQILNNYLIQLGGHKGPCAISKSSGKCKKSDKPDGNCKVSDKGRCIKINKYKEKIYKIPLMPNFVLSPNNVWRKCSIIELSDDRVLIHYEGYGNEHDEWIELNSPRLSVDQKVARVFSVDLTNGGDIKLVKNPRPEYFNNPCIISGEECYNPTWSGEKDEDGNRPVNCKTNLEMDNMKKEHAAHNNDLEDEFKENKFKNIEEILSNAREGDLIEDLSESGYRLEGVYIIKRNSISGKLEVSDLDFEIQGGYGTVGSGFSLGSGYPVGYWGKASFEQAGWHIDERLYEPVHKNILLNLTVNDLEEELTEDMYGDQTTISLAQFKWGILQFPGSPDEVISKIKNMKFIDDNAYFAEVWWKSSIGTPSLKFGIAEIDPNQW